MINKLQPNEIIVVGTNENGFHYGGAAKQAFDDFGLKWGVGEGLSGQSYAFPTLNKEMEQRSEEELLNSIRILINNCEYYNNKTFILTSVGTGIAGFSIDYVKGLFNQFTLPNNLTLPEEWK